MLNLVLYILYFVFTFSYFAFLDLWSDSKDYVVSTKSEQNKSAESEWKVDNKVCSGFYIAPGSETLVSIQVINCFPLIVSI